MQFTDKKEKHLNLKKLLTLSRLTLGIFFRLYRFRGI